MKCINCKEKLIVFTFYDSFNKPVRPSMIYCNNSRCALCGLLTVMGLPDSTDIPVEKRKTND